MPGVKLIQYGDKEGLAALRVAVSDLDIANETCLVQAVCYGRPPGANVVVLEGVVPWGSAELDRALLMLASDGRTANMEVWAMRPPSEQRWSSVPVWWAFDISALLSKASTAALVVDAVNKLPFVPSPTELVAIDPHPQTISAAILDELATRLDAGVGWLYVERGSKAAQVAEREVSRASTPWGMRYRGAS